MSDNNNQNLKHPENIDFQKKIGSTTYIVTAHFNNELSADIASKVKSLIIR